MATVVDHLAIDRRVRVVRAFHDRQGIAVAVGATGLIRQLSAGLAGIVLEWEREGRRERLVFPLTAPEGPRNGHMRDYFVVLEDMSPPRKLKPARRPLDPSFAPPPLPPLAETPLRTWAQRDEALDRIAALAARGRHTEAEQQLQWLLHAPDTPEHAVEWVADAMLVRGEVLAREPDSVLYSWWRDTTLRLWYAWGSTATSGGEGAARWPAIQNAEQRLPER